MEFDTDGSYYAYLDMTVDLDDPDIEGLWIDLVMSEEDVENFHAIKESREAREAVSSDWLESRIEISADMYMMAGRALMQKLGIDLSELGWKEDQESKFIHPTTDSFDVIGDCLDDQCFECGGPL